MKASEVKQQVRACKSCALYKVGHGPIPFHGPVPNDIVIFGQNPGEQEDNQGRPFVGPAGQLLRRLVKDVGLDPSQLTYTNAVSCWTGPGNREPTRIEIIACKKNSMNQLAVLQPKLIFVTGRFALNIFRPDLKLEYARGKPMEWAKGTVLRGMMNTWGPTVLFTTYHPASALHGRSPNLAPKIREDLAAGLAYMEQDIWYNKCYVCDGPPYWQDEWGVVSCEHEKHRERLHSIPPAVQQELFRK